MSFWWIFKNHCRSSRFVIIMIVILLSFIGAIIKALWNAFPYALLLGVLNGAGIVSYVTKTLEPNASIRRNKERQENACMDQKELA
jgi:hypothetical protein